MFEVKLSKKEVTEINKTLSVYADGMDGSHKYYSANRNAANPKDDSLTGKKGEYLVAKHIKDAFGLDLQPDVAIYSSRKKNWSADLPYGTSELGLPDVHVKTCSQKTIDYAKTHTWTFQMSNNAAGRGGTDRLLQSNEYDKDLIALVFVPNWESDTGIVMHLAEWKKIKPFLRDPISPRLKGLKACVYTNDLTRVKNIEPKVQDGGI